MQQNSTPKSALAWGSDRSICKKLMRLLDLYLVIQKLFPLSGGSVQGFPAAKQGATLGRLSCKFCQKIVWPPYYAFLYWLKNDTFF
jgi:hypothetical protein